MPLRASVGNPALKFRMKSTMGYSDDMQRRFCGLDIWTLERGTPPIPPFHVHFGLFFKCIPYQMGAEKIARYPHTVIHHDFLSSACQATRSCESQCLVPEEPAYRLSSCCGCPLHSFISYKGPPSHFQLFLLLALVSRFSHHSRQPPFPVRIRNSLCQGEHTDTVLSITTFSVTL